MITRFVLVLMHWDRSGIKQCFGPYDTETLAERARDQLKGMPAFEGGEWDIKPCTDFSSPTGTPPMPLVIPGGPCRPAPMPVWPGDRWNDVTITCDAAGT